MKKIIILSMFLGLMLFSLNYSVHAQMMGGQTTADTPAVTTNTQTTQDEAAGKAIWDKLQNKQTTCKDLKDDDYDVLGDFFMGNMMGANHDSMNQMMKQRLGDDGEKQMHIAMGKRLSGCDTNASLPQGANYFMPMIGFSDEMMRGSWNNQSQGGEGSMMGNWGYGGHGNMMSNPYGIFGLLTWIVAFVFLILGSVYFWKGINKKK